MFSNFPIDLFRVVLQYLSMEEIAILDTSIVNYTTRSLFLETLHGLELTDMSRKLRNIGQICWLLSRKIAVTHISCDLMWGIMETSHQLMKALVVQNCDILKSISLTSCPPDFYSTLKFCLHLTSLSLVHCSITDVDICNLFNSDSQLPHSLTCLDLSRCSQLTSKSFSLISQKCSKIQHLYLNDNDSLSDSHVPAMMENCPDLRTLGLAGTSITDISVNLLLNMYPNIEVLNIDNCLHVSPDAKFLFMSRIIRRQLQSDNPSLQLQAARYVRKALSETHNPPLDAVISLGFVPILIQFLARDEDPTLQYESTWVLTNIASGTSAHTETVVSGGSIPRFIRLLDSPNLDVVEQAAWALGNISGDSVAFRDIILSSGALLHLSMISVSRISVLRNVTWAISNICRGKPSPAIDDLKVAFPFLLKQLTIDDIEVQVDACFAISYLSEGDNERITEVVQAGFLPPIVNILENTESATLRTAALRVIGNVLTGDEHPTQIVIDLGILPILYRLLDSPRKSITKEACWSISNITAGTLSQVQAVINADIIPKIIMLGNSSSQDISKECVWCLANALDKKNTEQTKYFVQQGVVSFLNRNLSIPDVRSMTVTLTAIKSIVQTDESFHQILVDTLGLQLQGLNTTDNLENSNLIGQILSDLKCPLPNL